MHFVGPQWYKLGAMQQLRILWEDLPPPPAPSVPTQAGQVHSSDEVGRWLSSRLRKSVSVVFTDNRSTMISFRESQGRMRVRVHNIFAAAGEADLAALADYLAGKQAGARQLDAFIRAHPIQRTRSALGPVREAGRFHNLRDIWSELNNTHFHGASRARITWGTASSRRYRRTIQLGCYLRDQGLIRLHPALDQVFVPRHYISWIVFHEMLHEVFGVEERGGRRCVHPPEFMVVEQSYPDYGRCKAWEADNLHRLLRYRPSRST